MLDNTDYRILNFLQGNAKMSNSEIARQLNMTPSGILERIRKLEKHGYIKEYVTILENKKLNASLLAFIFVRAVERPGESGTGAELAKIPQIQEIHHITGEDCYLLKVRVANTDELADLMDNKIGIIGTVTSTRTTISLKTLKETVKLEIKNGVLAGNGKKHENTTV